MEEVKELANHSDWKVLKVIKKVDTIFTCEYRLGQPEAFGELKGEDAWFLTENTPWYLAHGVNLCEHVFEFPVEVS